MARICLTSDILLVYIYAVATHSCSNTFIFSLLKLLESHLLHYLIVYLSVYATNLIVRLYFVCICLRFDLSSFHWNQESKYSAKSRQPWLDTVAKMTLFQSDILYSIVTFFEFREKHKFFSLNISYDVVYKSLTA